LKISNNLRLFAILSFFFVSLFFVFNVKSFILVFIILFALLFFIEQYSLALTTFITLVLSLPFENNLRQWVIPVTQRVFIDVPTSGYELFFGFSLKIIFGLFLFLLLIRYKKSTDPIPKSDIALILFLILGFFSTFYFWNLITIVGLVRLWLSIFFYFAAKVFFKDHPWLFPILITGIYIFSTFFGLAQLSRQKPLGKFIELVPSFSQEEGYSTTDGKSQYRVSGYISHPVYFGSFMGILLPIFIASIYGFSPIVALFGGGLGILVMLGTHSRTTWFTIFLSLLLLYPQISPSRKYILSLITRHRLIVLLFIAASLFLVISRLPSITSLFTKNGNGSIRGVLALQSLIIISQNPLGVGLNQFTKSLTDLPLPPSLNGFIVPVHNTILLITSELGVLGGALFIYFVIKTLLVKKTKNVIHFSAIIGALAFIVSSQFHPLLNLDPTFDLFMLTLGFISSQCLPSKT